MPHGPAPEALLSRPAIPHRRQGFSYLHTLLVEYTDLVSVIVLIVARPPAHYPFSIRPQSIVIYFSCRFPRSQHILKCRYIQLAILRPVFKLSALCCESTQRAAYTTQPPKSRVIERTIGDIVFADKLPNIVLGKVDDWIDYNLACAVTVFNRAACRVIVIIKYNPPPPARFLSNLHLSPPP